VAASGKLDVVYEEATMAFTHQDMGHVFHKGSMFSVMAGWIAEILLFFAYIAV